MKLRKYPLISPALVDFLRQSREGLLEVDDPGQTAAGIIALCAAEETYAEIVWRIRNACNFPQEAFNALMDYALNCTGVTRWVKAVSTATVEQWAEGGVKVPDFIVRHAHGVDLAKWLFEGHRSGTIKEGHIFYFLEGGVADEFWGYEVRRHIESGDYMRAWDSLRRAHLGVAVARKGVTDRPYKATPYKVGKLADELYTVMSAKDLVPDLNATDLEVRLADKDQSLRMRRPGYDFASVFCDKELVPTLYLPVGAKIIAMAKYFSDRKNGKRRQESSQKSGEHQAQHV